MKIKHSKYKNTGILFELLVRQITSDTLSGKQSPAMSIMKKYFVKSELSKEYKLYEILLKKVDYSESKAEAIINTLLESSRKLNKKNLKREKYNLISEIKKHYNLDEFFKTHLPHYKTQASFYILNEIYNQDTLVDPDQIINHKITLLEHLSSKPVNKQEVTNNLIEEFKSYDKDLRILTYRVLLEKFNGKYEDFNSNQKSVLKEFINSIDSTVALRDFYNQKVNEIKTDLSQIKKKTPSPVVKIKIEEVNNMLTELDKTVKPNDDHLTNLLQYYSLLEELEIANG